MDITETLTPKSDQLNAEDLLAGSRTVTVEKVTKGSVEQPVDIHLTEFPGRPFRPSKTVRRILVAAWGPEATAYTGRRMTIYRDPAIRFGGEAVGGIRVSHLSHIDKPLTLALTETRGKRRPHRIEPLADAPPPKDDGRKELSSRLDALLTKGGLPRDRRDDRVLITSKLTKRDVASAADLTPGELAALVEQLEKWDEGGVLLTTEIGDILDMATIEAEGTK